MKMYLSTKFYAFKEALPSCGIVLNGVAMHAMSAGVPDVLPRGLHGGGVPVGALPRQALHLLRLLRQLRPRPRLPGLRRRGGPLRHLLLSRFLLTSIRFHQCSERR